MIEKDENTPSKIWDIYGTYGTGYKIINEISNCHFWLDKQIQALKPKLIVSLGNVALKSLKLYFKDSVSLKKFSLKENVGDTIKDTTPWIYPLYHTSKRAQMTRSVEEQKRDWLKIKDILLELAIPK